MKTIIQKNLRRMARFYAMGLGVALRIIHNRLRKYWFCRIHKKRWRSDASYHTWDDICARKHLGFMLRSTITTSFETLFKQLTAHTYWKRILNDPLFTPHLPHQDAIRHQADAIVHHKISLLGFDAYTFPSHGIPWHTDFTTNTASPLSWHNAFYNDITIPEQLPQQPEYRLPDIKIPWELSRFHYFFILGLAHRAEIEAHNNDQATVYAQTFANYFNDWADKNPYCQGVNWVNPMEVAIRSINLIWAFHFFSKTSSPNPNFWQRFVCILYDHATYLEHNWEVSDKPNNHYIADLVGYLYLSVFFGDRKQQQQTLLTIEKQMKHQILPDGTCYEGSTHYHALDTELLLHVLLLCKHTELVLPTYLEQTITNMIHSKAAYTSPDGTIIQIGDNDGGKIVTGLTPTAIQQPLVQTKQHFGLTIILTPRLHITFRHPIYQAHQPTGHFHYDMLSYTLCVDGTPIIIDPGTYLYTAHPTLRNYLRSFAAHNTFYIDPDPITQSNNDLFQLQRRPQSFTATIKATDKTITIHDFYNHYQQIGLTAHRKLELDQQKNELIIIDWWVQEKNDINVSALHSAWSLHFAPGITLEKKDFYLWTINKDSSIIGVLRTSCEYSITTDFFSPTYGSLQSCWSLRAKTSQANAHQYIGITIS